MPPAVVALAPRSRGNATLSPQRSVPDRELAGLRRLANLLDRGVDPLLGLLLPGAGDVIGTLLGGTIVASAVRRRLPVVVIARMLINLALDAIVGIVPLAGDLFDFAFQANRKNLALLEARAPTGKATARDWAYLGVAIALLVGALATVLYLGYRIVSWLASAL